MKIGSMFTGYGGLDMAVEQVTGATPAWFVEHDPAPSKILAHHWPTVPNHHDVTAVDWDSVEPVDILTAGFPCQDLSHAGKRLGLRPGTRSGLWEHTAYAIDQLRPRLVVIENVRGLLSANAHSDLEPCPWCVGGAADGEPALRALGAVLGDLAGLGYDARWSSVRAADVGAPHGRFRVFIVAHPAADPGGSRRDETVQHNGSGAQAVDGASVPHQPDSDSGGAGPNGGLVGVGPILLPTPQARDHKDGGLDKAGGVGAHRPGDADSVPRAVRSLLPTPRATRGGAATESTALLPTPKASDGPNGGPGMRNGRGQADALPGVPDFGPYAPAIARWEAILGRPAPSPTEPGKDDRPRLSPAFVEFLMGLPAGHVTDPAIGLTRAQQLKALGNGVVPQQADAGLRFLLRGEPVGAAAGAALLPTPNPFHAGNEEDPDEWRARRADVFKRTGTRHGPALGVVAKSLLPGEVPLTVDTYMPEED